VIFGSWERVLVLAPHTDDGEFGCGGTMARLVDSGADVRYVAFSIATGRCRRASRRTRSRARSRGDRRARHPEANLTVHDFDVRTFPERRQDILEVLIALWEDWSPTPSSSRRSTTSTRTTR
jgi:LmbE family N-acetylglucosaminyl deacetylase